jgi:thiosulfate/3-mercaptopyruvate sulfurtransferase
MFSGLGASLRAASLIVAVLGVGLATSRADPAATIAEQASPLVSTAWLKQRLGDPNLSVLDIRSAIDGGGHEAYLKAHIPGAVHSDYDKGGWRVARNDMPSMLPTVAELEKLIGELGIDEDSYVVVVPAGVHVLDFGAAARVYWTLRAMGHVNVSILDGGFAAWTSEPGNKTEAGDHRPVPRIFTANPDPRLVANVGDVEQAVQSGSATLVDARPPSFYAGREKHPGARTYGHIPGAQSIDSARFYDPHSNRLRPKAELAAIAGVPAGPVVAYCNTGHWAATDWFVLSEVLGRTDVKLYPGSMVEWSADAKRPVASERTKWDDLKKTLGFGS